MNPLACELLLELSNVMYATGFAAKSILNYLREMRYLQRPKLTGFGSQP
ncbi:MAG: hypothetical protein ACI87N_003555 [Flavobacteriales bacterium]